MDVYSYCLTLHHVLSMAKSFAECANAMQVLYAVGQGKRPDAARLPANLRQCVTLGWNRDPRRRPTMQEVLERVDPAAAAMARDEQELRDDAASCVICMQRPRSHVLTPCGHWCVCEEDAKQQRCPICRADVAAALNVFQ